MRPDLAGCVAKSLGATPELLPYLSELLADLDELGGSSQLILTMLKRQRLPPGASVLDLGCGKGAISVLLAEHLGVSVVGIDAFEPFIADARRLAQERSCGARCDFHCTDIRSLEPKQKEFDVVLFVGLGLLLGTLQETVGMLRRWVRPSGFIVIDDGFVAPDINGSVIGYEQYSKHEETLRHLTAYGDTLLIEHIPSPEEISRANEANTSWIRQRAEELARKQPQVKALVSRYVERQEQEGRIELTSLIPAVWLLQRSKY